MREGWKYFEGFIFFFKRLVYDNLLGDLSDISYVFSFRLWDVGDIKLSKI